MISISNARMDDGNKIKTLVDIIHTTTTRKEHPRDEKD